jgi:hypothetical protein
MMDSKIYSKTNMESDPRARPQLHAMKCRSEVTHVGDNSKEILEVSDNPNTPGLGTAARGNLEAHWVILSALAAMAAPLHHDV